MPATTTPTRRAAYWLGYGACALAGCFWGTGFYFGKVVLASMGVGHMVFYRFVFACIGLLPFALRHRPQLNAREWRLLLIASFLGIPVQYLVQFYGLSLTTVSACLAHGRQHAGIARRSRYALCRRAPGSIGWAALVSSTIGVAMIVLAGHHAQGGNRSFTDRRSAGTGSAPGFALLDPDE